MIDLSWFLGTYTPILDPVTGQIASDMAGVDWAYIIRAVFLLVSVMTIYMAFARFIKGGRR